MSDINQILTNCSIVLVIAYITAVVPRPCIAQTSERSELGYNGIVRSVRAESAKFISTGGVRKPGERKPSSVEHFDRQGNQIEEIEYDDNGILNWHDKALFQNGRKSGWKVKTTPAGAWDEFHYKFDVAGRIAEQFSYNESGVISLRTRYVYDVNGRKVEEVDELIYPDRTEATKTTFAYDESGRMKEQKKFLNQNGEFVPHERDGYHRRLFMYSDRKSWTTAASFSAAGNLVSINRLSRDRYDNETEGFEYDGAGKLKSAVRYVYVYDNRGNWIEEKLYRLRPGADERLVLDEITYRTITYFRN